MTVVIPKNATRLFKSGHTYYRDERGRVFLHDDSGDAGELDLARPIMAPHNGSMYAPLVDGDSTPINAHEALCLVRHFGLKIRVSGVDFAPVPVLDDAALDRAIEETHASIEVPDEIGAEFGGGLSERLIARNVWRRRARMRRAISAALAAVTGT